MTPDEARILAGALVESWLPALVACRAVPLFLIGVEGHAPHGRLHLVKSPDTDDGLVVIILRRALEAIADGRVEVVRNAAEHYQSA